jgi:hypothetical protein
MSMAFHLFLINAAFVATIFLLVVMGGCKVDQTSPPLDVKTKEKPLYEYFLIGEKDEI